MKVKGPPFQRFACRFRQEDEDQVSKSARWQPAYGELNVKWINLKKESKDARKTCSRVRFR